MKNKKIFKASCFTTLIVLASALYAQEASDLSVSLGFEDNGNTRQGRALGVAPAVQYSPFRWLSAGIKGEFSHDFNTIATTEGGATLRWTFWRPAGISLFAEGFAGVSAINVNEKGKSLKMVFCGCGAVGARFPAGKLYAEPYVSFGYPRMLGLGVNIGYNFQVKIRPRPQVILIEEEREVGVPE